MSPRRGLALALAALALVGLAAVPRPARAFGDEGAFDPRPLLTGQARFEGLRATAPAAWSAELRRRTSAPAREAPEPVRADSDQLLAEPFAWWLGDEPLAPLTSPELDHLRRFFAQGGLLLVDDADPRGGAFGRDARRELARVLPDAAPIALGPEHVLFRSFYLLRRAVGRVEGPAKLDAIVRGGDVQVVFSAHDLAGALARTPSGVAAFPVEPGGDSQREQATRLAVNLAMYALCSNYKDDQVHAPFLMRRRGRATP